MSERERVQMIVAEVASVKSPSEEYLEGAVDRIMDIRTPEGGGALDDPAALQGLADSLIDAQGYTGDEEVRADLRRAAKVLEQVASRLEREPDGWMDPEDWQRMKKRSSLGGTVFFRADQAIPDSVPVRITPIARAALLREAPNE